MKLLQLPSVELRRQLAGAGIWLRTGPFSLKLQSRIPFVAESLTKLYGQFEVRNPHEAFADFHVSVNPVGNVHRWLRPRAAFSFDGMQPFKPLPRDQAFSMLESGLNWCVSTQAHHYLVLHAAAVEKNGLAVILPGLQGCGKSTLAAGLVLSGWRLLSDELTLVDRKTGQIQPLPRPISLKNEAIGVIRQFSADAYINRASHIETRNMVAHLRPPRESVRRQHETAHPGWFVFPKWEAGAATQFTPRPQAQALMHVTQAAFTHDHPREEALRSVAAQFDQTPCLDFRYSRLHEAVAAFDKLANSTQHA